MLCTACAGQLSKAVDVYAFGVLLWEMCTGARPWAGLMQMQVCFHTIELLCDKFLTNLTMQSKRTGGSFEKTAAQLLSQVSAPIRH